jgi:putative phosphoribosyl transferase
MRFRNRLDAAELLAERLIVYAGTRPLVLGIPRGGVPMAAVIARRLHGDLDVMLVHKLRAPEQPELAIGSVDESGRVYLAPFSAVLGLDRVAMAGEVRQQLTLLRARRQRYSATRAPFELAGRTVLLVDDGLATGSTAIAAVRAARAQGAARVVIAAAVAPPATVAALRTEADEVVCLQSPAAFHAVGEFFADFSEVSDQQVVAELAAAAAEPVPVRAAADTPS